MVPSATTTRAAAIEEKKQAPNIIDVQPLSEIVKLPDINIAEALQRVPGISLETDSGEGRFINIRGMDCRPQRRDVRRGASAGFECGIALRRRPRGRVRYLSHRYRRRSRGHQDPAPDMDAEGLGGSINLLPRTGAEYGGKPVPRNGLRDRLRAAARAPRFTTASSIPARVSPAGTASGVFSRERTPSVW